MTGKQVIVNVDVEYEQLLQRLHARIDNIATPAMAADYAANGIWVNGIIVSTVWTQQSPLSLQAQ